MGINVFQSVGERCTQTVVWTVRANNETKCTEESPLSGERCFPNVCDLEVLNLCGLILESVENQWKELPCALLKAREEARKYLSGLELTNAGSW